MKRWLKSGLYGANVYLVILVFALLYCISSSCSSGGCQICDIFFRMPLESILLAKIILFQAGYLLIFFIIGSVIGAIVQITKTQASKENLNTIEQAS